MRSSADKQARFDELRQRLRTKLPSPKKQKAVSKQKPKTPLHKERQALGLYDMAIRRRLKGRGKDKRPRERELSAFEIEVASIKKLLPSQENGSRWISKL